MRNYDDPSTYSRLLFSLWIGVYGGEECEIWKWWWRNSEGLGALGLGSGILNLMCVLYTCICMYMIYFSPIICNKNPNDINVFVNSLEWVNL